MKTNTKESNDGESAHTLRRALRRTSEPALHVASLSLLLRLAGAVGLHNVLVHEERDTEAVRLTRNVRLSGTTHGYPAWKELKGTERDCRELKWTEMDPAILAASRKSTRTRFAGLTCPSCQQTFPDQSH